MIVTMTDEVKQELKEIARNAATYWLGVAIRYGGTDTAGMEIDMKSEKSEHVDLWSCRCGGENISGRVVDLDDVRFCVRVTARIKRGKKTSKKVFGVYGQYKYDMFDDEVIGKVTAAATRVDDIKGRMQFDFACISDRWNGKVIL